MAELKTRRHDGDVNAFLESVENETRRRDAFAVKEMMTRISGEQPAMWGPSIVGFGSMRYENSRGKANDWLKIGFSPRKQSLTLYIREGFDGYQSLLGRLGSHSTGKSCLYIKDMEKVDTGVLEEIITRSLEQAERLG